MGKIFTKGNLDNLQCDHCSAEDGVVYLHSKCHPRSPTWSSYLNGILKIECARCGETILAIKVSA